MSAKLMGTVWELNIPEHVQGVLLALCDHAKPDGSDCYPSVGRVAWMLGKGERQVRYTMAWLRERGILVLMQKGGGRGNAARYRIELDHVARKPAFVPGKDEADSRVSDDAIPAADGRVSGSETLQSPPQQVERNPAMEAPKTLQSIAGEPTDEPRSTPTPNPPYPPAAPPLVLISESNGNGESAETWMHAVWQEELGNGQPLRLTPSRRQKYRAMFAEQLRDAPDPRLAWRAVLRAAKRNKHTMSERAYQMPESLLKNEDRRDRWVQETVSLIETSQRQTAAASEFAAAYRARRAGGGQ